MRELDAERTARQKSERAADDLRSELTAARHEARDAAVAQAEARARLEAQAAALTDRLTTAAQAQRKSVNDLGTVQAELAAALRMGPPERDGSGRRRKAGSAAPTEQQAQSEKQGAPTTTLNPDDGSDGNDGNDGNDSQQ